VTERETSQPGREAAGPGGASEQYDEHKVVVRDRRKIDPLTGAPREPEPAEAAAAAGAGEQPAPAGAADEFAALRAQLVERTVDLQRITAEYANYRKRVDRDRATVVDGATRAALTVLLPVLDDIERARNHGDLTGAFKSVADQLEGTLEKLGLRAFGAGGDPFDPTLHEAVAHQISPDVTVPTCTDVLRRGYKHGDRLLRAALVAVADPAPPPAPATEPVAPTDLPEAAGEPAADALGRGPTQGGPAQGGPAQGGPAQGGPAHGGQPGQPGAGD
jgi:molecular chaperone GrpE